MNWVLVYAVVVIQSGIGHGGGGGSAGSVRFYTKEACEKAVVLMNSTPSGTSTVAQCIYDPKPSK